MLRAADDAGLAIEVEFIPTPLLAEGDLGRHAAGRGESARLGGGAGRRAVDIVLVDGLADGLGVHCTHVAVQ